MEERGYGVNWSTWDKPLEQALEVARHCAQHTFEQLRQTIGIVLVSCCRKRHRIQVTSQGRLLLLDHAEGTDEGHRVLAAFNGEKSRCYAVARAWEKGYEGDLPRQFRKPFRSLFVHHQACQRLKEARLLLLGAQTFEEYRAARAAGKAGLADLPKLP